MAMEAAMEAAMVAVMAAMEVAMVAVMVAMVAVMEVAITAVAITAVAIAADYSALACSAGAVFVESVEGMIVATRCRRTKDEFIQTRFRFCGPLEPFYDKTWRPGDPEIVE